MRKQIVSLAAAASLTLATVSSISAQVVGPVFPLPAPGVPPVPAPIEASPFDEGAAIAVLRPLLAGRGFDESVARGPMFAIPPGQVSGADFHGDPEMDAPLAGIAAGAYLVWTEAGRWWVWEYGASAPADQRAAVYETHFRRQAAERGFYVGS